MKKTLNNFIIFLGLCLVLFYIYINFIRQRLPREIPFDLTEFRFYTLCFICFIYAYAIYRTLYPKITNILIIKVFTLLIRPIILFIHFIKKLKAISRIYYDIWLDLVEFLGKWTWSDNILFIYMLTIIPRILLSFIFMVEVFYYFIFLGIFPLLYTLFLKYLENIQEEYLVILEYLYTKVDVFDDKINYPDYDYNPKAIYHEKTVTIRKYLEILYDLFLFKEDDLKYEGMPYSTQQRIDEYKKKFNKTSEELTMDDFNIQDREFNYIMPKLLIIKIFLDYSTKEGHKSAYIPEIKLFILCMYLLCWAYILLISFHTLDILNLLEIIKTIKPFEDPFSENKIF